MCSLRPVAALSIRRSRQAGEALRSSLRRWSHRPCGCRERNSVSDQLPCTTCETGCRERPAPLGNEIRKVPRADCIDARLRGQRPRRPQHHFLGDRTNIGAAPAPLAGVLRASHSKTICHALRHWQASMPTGPELPHNVDCGKLSITQFHILRAFLDSIPERRFDARCFSSYAGSPRTHHSPSASPSRPSRYGCARTSRGLRHRRPSGYPRRK